MVLTTRCHYLEITTSNTRMSLQPETAVNTIASFLSVTGAVDLFQSCAVCEHVPCWSDKPVGALSTLRPMELDPRRLVYSPVSRHHSAESQAQWCLCTRHALRIATSALQDARPHCRYIQSRCHYTQCDFSAAKPVPACLVVISRLSLHPASSKPKFTVLPW